MKNNSSSSKRVNEVFDEALASVLRPSKEQIQDKIAQAKAEKVSPHTRYKYVPGEGHS